MAEQEAPPPTSIYPLFARPGIKRDGTLFDNDYYSDGQWCRFQRGRPRKMGGYRAITTDLSGPPDELFVSGRNGFNTIHSGSANNLERLQVDAFGNATGITDRTPASGFVADANNLWQFDAIFDAGSSSTRIVAHAAPNAAAIDQETATNIFYGDIEGTAQLTNISGSNNVPTISGGLVVAHPYVFYYSHAGFITWSGPNLPNDCTTANGGGGAGGQRITSAKIVRGLVNRGGPTNAPSALFWSLDSLIRASFIGGAPVFRFDTISDQSSILSSSGAIEYDGLYYWVGVDRFLFYNGVVQELPNQMNINFFFDNLNFQQRQAVFATKTPRYGEIMWCFPKGTNQVHPNWAVIYNVREQTWYDTPLPEGGRSAAFFSQIFQYPVMAGVEANAASKYTLWQHEYGVDKVTPATAPQTTAIASFFETGPIALSSEGPLRSGWSGVNQNLILDQLEPDFLVSGELTVTVKGRPYAMAPDGDDATIVITPLVDPQGQPIYKQDFRQPTSPNQFRQMRFRFDSNVVGGDYQMGKPLITLHPGDGRPT